MNNLWFQLLRKEVITMTEISFKPYDLEIKKILNRNTEEYQEIVQIRPNLAFNPAFIKEMKEAGVSEYIKKDDIE